MQNSDNNHQNHLIQQSMQLFVNNGQMLAKSFFEMLTRNHSDALSSVGLSLPPLPPMPGKVFLGLQKRFAEKHFELWTAVLNGRLQDNQAAALDLFSADGRFKATSWQKNQMSNYLRQAYLINADFLREAAESIPLSDERMKARLLFLTRQYLDALSPSNFAATNPEFIEKAAQTDGASIEKGLKNLLNDLAKGRISMTDEHAFEVGKNIATSPGMVIFENAVMQLIQYSPATDRVAKTPLLIVPPCINKYYILDLSEDNSMVRFLVAQGITVFMVSWKNPQHEEQYLSWDDYVAQGPLAALAVVRSVSRVRKPHTLGFCVGGTLLACALAIEFQQGRKPVASMTLMTALLAFSDVGELGCFVDEESVRGYEKSIGNGGLLSAQQLSNTFASLRANSLVWQYVIDSYLKGEAPRPLDLLYWNSDGTNLPGPFFAWYLRNMYLEDNLARPGHLHVLGIPVDLSKIDVPTYLFAAREDHIVPWQGAYHSRALLGGDSVFVLGESGHIAGAINAAQKNRRNYWVNPNATEDTPPDRWYVEAEKHPGSWWLHWFKWLISKEKKWIPAPGALGNVKYVPIESAPGRYVHEKAEKVEN